MGFFRQEYRSGLPFAPLGDLPNPGIKTVSFMSAALQADSLPAETSGKPCTQLQIICCCLAIYLLLLIASSFLSVSLYLPAALSLFPLYLLLLLSPYYNSKHNKEPHHGSRFRQKTTALASSFSFSSLRMIEASYC